MQVVLSLDQGQGSTGGGGGGTLAHISSQAAGGMNVSVGGAGAGGGPPHGIHFERYPSIEGVTCGLRGRAWILLNI